MKGLITKSTGLWYEVKVDGGVKVARLRGKHRLAEKKITNPIAVGDWVEIERNGQADEWAIEKIYPRDNYVIRKSPRKKGHDHLIASNVDQGVVIVTLKMPRTSVGFIDRFLVSLEAFRIPALIIFNKSDLYTNKEQFLFNELKAIYEKIGYAILLTSFTTDKKNSFRDLFLGKRSLVSGHSGSGKSTLVNRLVPDASQETKEVSDFANKGVHTTTFAEMFEIDNGSSIIDTPGIKELGLADIDEYELAHYFPEMRDLLGMCKFHNCLHENEPGCHIKKNIGSHISERRYLSYLSILRNEDNRK